MTQPTPITPPDGNREARRYLDYFNRMGVTRKSVLESVDLTYQRSNVYFGDLYAWMAETGNFRVACDKGCAYCCHTMVSVLPPEAFFLANHIETAFEPDISKAMRQRVIEHDAAHRGLSGAARHEGHIACPMLDPETWLCTVHGARPLTCRSMHSSDKPSCKKAFDERDAYISTPSHQLFFENTQAYYDAFGTALQEHGVEIEPLELNAALATIWTEKNVLNRWIAGEKVFEAAYADKMMTDRPPTDSELGDGPRA